MGAIDVALTIAVVSVSMISLLAYAVVGEAGVFAASGCNALSCLPMTFVYIWKSWILRVNNETTADPLQSGWGRGGGPVRYPSR